MSQQLKSVEAVVQQPASLKPNRICGYSDYQTGELLFEREYLDSSMRWMRDQRTGQVFLYCTYQEGRPTDEWLKSNPRPR